MGRKDTGQIKGDLVAGLPNEMIILAPHLAVDISFIENDQKRGEEMKTRNFLKTIILLSCIFSIVSWAGDSLAAYDSPFGVHTARISEEGYQGNGFSNALNLGVQWSRESIYAYWSQIQPDLSQSVYNFETLDSLVSSYPSGIQILMNLAPQAMEEDSRCIPGTWIPVDQQQYAAFVKALVERYDGDGVDDMPNLTSIVRYWQVGNEPNDLVRTDFAVLQQITYVAIKEADPASTVLMGGTTSSAYGWVHRFKKQHLPILKALAGQYVDVFDFHFRGNATGEYRLKDSLSNEDILDAFRTGLQESGFPADMSIWCTEMSSYSGQPVEPDYPLPLPYQSERQQATDYVKRFVYTLSRGVDRISLAFGIMEGLKHADAFIDHTGLIYDGKDSQDSGLGVKKLSYYSYKKMTELLSGVDWSSAQIVRENMNNDHIYLIVANKNGSPIVIGWWDYFDDPAYVPGATTLLELKAVHGTHVDVKSFVPFFETGADVTDYGTAFQTTTYPVTLGAVTIVLDENPVLIEGIEGFDTQDITVTPEYHDFGALLIGKTVPKTVIVSNAGTSDLLVTGIAIAGQNANEFGLLNDTCSGQTIPAAGECAFDILFSPLSVGSKTGTVTITSSDLDTPAKTIALDGSGENPYVAPHISANGNSGSVTVQAGTMLSITRSLDAGNLAGAEADWWVLIGRKPSGWASFKDSNNVWVKGITVSHQGQLLTLGNEEIFRDNRLPAGEYVFYFGIDLNKNGSVDLKQFYYESVTVKIVK